MTVNIALFDDLDAVAADAGGALDRASEPCLFRRLDWFRLVHDHVPPPGKLLVVGAGDDSAKAWLPLARQGSRASAYAAWYSLRFDAAGSRDPSLLAGLVSGLKGMGRVELAPLADPEPLREAFEGVGWSTFVSEKTGNWRIDTKGMDFEAYWATRPSQLRNTTRRKAKAAGLEIEIFDRFDPLAWEAYEEIYRASWKGEEGSFAFLRALAEQEGKAGTLRLGLARKDGQPIAAQLWLIENKEATIHKLAYREDMKALSPGTILGEAMFRRALDVDRVAAIDYGTGDDPYKRDWMAERRPLWRLLAFNPRHPLGLLGLAREKASALVRRGRSG
ncbi:MAG TPA: GNAT family N-acetyltransferase [Allosphingosinicella sp.]|nr:GNAT family N-acetyltransferase [Allosphingosinicella sp.]